MRPGCSVKTSAGQEARLIWVDPVKNQAGIFFIHNGQTVFDTVESSSLEEIADDSPFKHFNKLSPDEILAKLNLKTSRQQQPRTKSAAVIPSTPAEINKALENLPDNAKRALVKQLLSQGG